MVFLQIFQFSSVQSLSCVRLFASSWTQHTRPPCPSPTSRVYPNLCPLSWWCHPTISSSVIPFSSCPQSFPSIKVFSNESALHICGQSIVVSASASVLPMNTQGWSPSEWTGWISLQSKGLMILLPLAQVFFYLIGCFFLVVRFILENVLGALCYVLSHSVLHYPLWPHGW